MSKTYSFGKRLMALLLSAILVFGMVPASQVFAEGAEQTGFGFETANPEALTYKDGLTYTNTASGGEGSGEVTYEVTDGKDVATVDETTGEVTVLKAGTAVITATKAADDTYGEATASYTLTIREDVFAFAVAAPENVTYAEGLTFENAASGGGDGYVGYEITDGEDVAQIDNRTGKLTILKAGTVEVTATKYSMNYATVSYKLTIEKAEQTGFAFVVAAPADFGFGYNNNAYTNSVTGAKGEGKLTYVITAGEDVASINESTGELTIKELGSVTVKATKEGDDCYEAAEATYTMNVVKGSQSTFGFQNGNAAEVAYNDNGNKYTNPVVNAMGEGALTYAIVAGDDVATIDAATGELTILKPGSVTVKAAKEADGYYNAAEAEYTLTIVKDDQTIAFDSTKVDGTYGLTRSYTNTYTQSDLHGTGALTFEIVGDNNIKATIDAATGALTLGYNAKVGEITIRVTVAEDEYYNSCSAEYTFKLSYATSPSKSVVLSGNQDKDTDWYKGDVTITAPDGYQISYSNSYSDSNAWADSVVYSTEGENEVTVYLKKDNGGITKGIEVDLKIDKTAPVDLAISYTTDSTVELNGVVYAVDAEKITITFTADDAHSGIVKMEYSLDGGKTFTQVNERQGAYKISVEPQFRDQLALRATDKAGNSTIYTDANVLVLDNIAPVIDVTYTGAYNGNENVVYSQEETFTVNFQVTDANFDLQAAAPVVTVNGSEQTLTWTDGQAALPLTEENTYNIAVTYTDASGNKATQQTVVCLDKTAPEVTISYASDKAPAAVEPGADGFEDIVATPGADTRFVYSGAVTVTVAVNETNFHEKDVTIKVDGKEVKDLDWENNACNVTITEDGDHVVTVSYKDRAGKQMNWSSAEYTGKSGNGEYTSNVITIDTTKPVITVDYVTAPVQGAFYDKALEAVVTIVDANFRPDEVILTAESKDAASAAVTNTAALVDWTKAGENTWKANVTFAEDGNYNIKVDYTDIANNVAQAVTGAFTVDNENPVSLEIAYDDANQYSEGLLSVLYYGAEATLTLSADDLTSGVNAMIVDVFTNRINGTTTINVPNQFTIYADGKVDGNLGDLRLKSVSTENGKMTAVLMVPVEFRGEFRFTAIDRADRKTLEDDSYAIVTDSIAPDFSVDYTPTQKLTDAEGNEVLFYNVDAVATFKIKEANFFAEDIKISVEKDEVAYTDYVVTEWTAVEDEANTYSLELTMAEEGDYVITVAYTDRSANAMETYTSQVITVDKTAPVIDVVYSDNNPVNTIEDRKYFANFQTATVIITEHNFRADDVVVHVDAKDVLGNDVMNLNADGFVEEYALKGVDAEAWEEIGEDTYALELVFSTDANYTLSVDYKDMATNPAENYSDMFTVDVTAPENLEVSYSTNVFQEVLEAITFGYYNANMTVTITATDVTSGIYHFDYSYINNANVSKVNAELLDQAIQEAEITYEGTTATATFTIPKEVLGSNNQFNGTVKFTAYDRSENDTLRADDKNVIIVDNIAPTATITYNAAVQQANGISYYAGNILATITVNEANFDASDVAVSVTKGGTYYPVNVSWYDNSVDTHTGTFTLAEDGDYVVSVQYKDKSQNAMANYTSNQLTVDTVIPEIHVSDIVANSANKDEVYGFTIRLTDINLDASSMKPVLTAVVKNDDGLYTTKEIDLGEAETVVAGKEYLYTVENLTEDALYTLTCEVKDMSGNAINKVVLDDEKSYTEVQFSVNRAGSTFGFGSEATEELINQYYVYNVKEDVVIFEVNVDPIEEYVVTLNGVELVEGTDYTTEQTSNDGEWSKRTYTISKDLFADEGEYSIIVNSTDKAGTAAYSDVKNLVVAFVVDQTAPVLTITGLANGGRYQTNEQTVTVIPTDEGGRLDHLKIVVLDADGNPLTDESGKDISLRFEMSGEELLTYLDENDGKVTFTIPEGLNNQVKIICDDCAVGGEDDANTYDETFTKVTVSQSGLVIFYANKPLFYGVIGGALALIILIILLLKRKKDNKEKTGNAAKA